MGNLRIDIRYELESSTEYQCIYLCPYSVDYHGRLES